MFTSLKVVRMALVDCDCSRRSAIRARRRLIGTRSSGRSPRLAGPVRRLAAAPAWRPARPAGRSGRLTLVGDGGQGVALGHAAVAAGAGDVGGAHVVVGQDLGGGRHGDVALAAPVDAAEPAAVRRGGRGVPTGAAVMPIGLVCADASVSMMAMTSPATTVRRRP
jgi:hypothetical protein